MFGVLIPVGPSAREVSRLESLLGELERFEEPEGLRLLVVDDATEPRDLPLISPDPVVVRTALWSGGPPDPMSAHVAGTLEGLRAAQGLEFVVKLDTDAAVIRPFSHAIRRAFVDRDLGVVGSYDRTSDAGRRDWSVWETAIARAAWPLTVSRAGNRLRIWWRPVTHRRHIRRITDAAYRFAPPGAHCLGGAYAVSSRFLHSASLDWRPWMRSRLGEDVVVGLLSSAAGLRMSSLTAPGEPFALSWRGLPLPPPEIVSRGHSIVHSVKAEDEQDELVLRGLLQKLAATG